jgi:hypothetical protein
MTRQNVDLPREPLPLAAASPFPEPREGANAGWAPADYIRLLNINTAKVSGHRTGLNASPLSLRV